MTEAKQGENFQNFPVSQENSQFGVKGADDTEVSKIVSAHDPNNSLMNPMSKQGGLDNSSIMYN